MERRSLRLLGMLRLGLRRSNLSTSVQHSYSTVAPVHRLSSSVGTLNSISRQIHTSQVRKREGPGNPEDTGSQQNNLPQLPDYVTNHIFLSDLSFSFLPNFWKSMRNRVFEFLIRGYFDPDFSISSFVTGATQAVLKVSNALADGELNELEQMDVLSPDLLAEVKENLAKMTLEQREFLRIDPNDILRQFIYEIGIIMDDDTDEKFVEILFVLHGQHGISNYRNEIAESGAEGLEKMRKVNSVVSNAMQPFGPHEFVCNYRFIRQYRSPSIDSTLASYWIINKLNHFRPLHYVLRQHFEDRSSRN